MTLRQAGVGADGSVTGQALVALYDRMFLVSQSFLPAVNAALLGSLLYKSRLVPRVLPLLGFVGAVLLVASVAATMHDLSGQLSSLWGLAVVPSRFGSFRWACIWSSRASSLPRSQPGWSPRARLSERARCRCQLPRMTSARWQVIPALRGGVPNPRWQGIVEQ